MPIRHNVKPAERAKKKRVHFVNWICISCTFDFLPFFVGKDFRFFFYIFQRIPDMRYDGHGVSKPIKINWKNRRTVCIFSVLLGMAIQENGIQLQGYISLLGLGQNWVGKGDSKPTLLLTMGIYSVRKNFWGQNVSTKNNSWRGKRTYF